jgi:hypothetical protein
MTYLTMRNLIEAASIVTGAPTKKILGGGRQRKFVHVRACIARLANEERLRHEGSRMRWSLPNIARGLGYTDHTTVINLIDKWDAYCSLDPGLPYVVLSIKQEAEKIAAGMPIEVEPRCNMEVVEVSPHRTILVPKQIYKRARNDFRPDSRDVADDSHKAQAAIRIASAKFAEALNAARAA